MMDVHTWCHWEVNSAGQPHTEMIEGFNEENIDFYIFLLNKEFILGRKSVVLLKLIKRASFSLNYGPTTIIQILTTLKQKQIYWNLVDVSLAKINKKINKISQYQEGTESDKFYIFCITTFTVALNALFSQNFRDLITSEWQKRIRWV